MLGEKYLQKKIRRTKPKLVTISILSLLESYESMLRTLKVLKPGESILAADDISDEKTPDSAIKFAIYIKGGKSKTKKD